MFEDSTHGGRQRNRAGCVGTHHFNSRPHGGRLCRRWIPPDYGHFNSRPHGGRPRFSGSSLMIVLFQLTPSRRATAKLLRSNASYAISTHALTEGDRVVRIIQLGTDQFQLTPSRRATPCPFLLFHHLVFQLTPSRRATECLDT